MYEDKHITKNYFFDVFEKRLREYEEAIFGTKKMAGMKLHLANTLLYHIQELKKTDTLYNLFGNFFWGYGINNICDGNDEYNNPDVFEVKNIGGLNKHHENYRYLFFLLFKVENSSFFISTFIIDSCGFKHVSKINKKLDLKDFKSYQIIKSGHYITIELFFDLSIKPIRFQIDTYHFGGYNLCGEKLAKYYVDEITNLSNQYKTSKINRPELKDEIDSLDGKINKVEGNLRITITDTLVNAFSKNDYESLITGEAKKQIKNCIREYIDLHPNSKESDFILLKDSIQFCNIDHLKKIVMKEENWPYFQTKFKEKSKVDKYFEQLNTLRKAVMHNRQVSELIAFEGKAAIEWFSMILN